MVEVKRSWLIVIIILRLLFTESEITAQQLTDVWQFPKLTSSKPFQRWWWAFQQRAYPLGDIPRNARRHALQQIEQSKATLPLSSQPVQGDSWVNIGPAPILGGQTSPPSPVSGRVTALAVDPNNSSRWLIGAAQGGVWETRNAGTTWTPKTDDQASLAIGAIAFALSNPSIIYAGTGEPNRSDSYAGVGLLKSTDGGTTWQRLAPSTFAKTTFSDIRAHPANPNIVLAATSYNGFAGRGGELPLSPPVRGIFKSTDGGTTWTRKIRGEATSLQVNPSNFNDQYAGIGDPFGSILNDVWRSTDAGETWRSINGPWNSMGAGVGRIELVIAPSNPSVLYVSIQDANNHVGNDGGLLGLWKTTNAWATTPTWTQITSAPSYCGSICWYAHELIVDPTNSNILYAGGVDLWKFNGTTWTKITNGIHADQHSMVWAGNRLIVGNDGGVWSTTNGGNTWTNHNGGSRVNTTLSITQFYDGSLHPTNPNFALAGSQDNGTEKWTGTDDWQWIYGGDGADNAISTTKPNTDWAVSSQNLNIRRTTNGGAGFASANTPESGDKTKAPFIARFEKCPANDNVLIAGTDNLWKSTNFFSAPVVIISGIPTAQINWSSNSPDMGAGISALAFAPSDSCTISFLRPPCAGR